MTRMRSETRETIPGGVVYFMINLREGVETVVLGVETGLIGSHRFSLDDAPRVPSITK